MADWKSFDISGAFAFIFLMGFHSITLEYNMMLSVDGHE
jgi:hypothetical protein